jgi:hypothetical protein
MAEIWRPHHNFCALQTLSEMENLKKNFCSDEKMAIFLLSYCTNSSLQQVSRKRLLVLLELSHYRSGNVMDYESNFGNIKKILRLPNLLGASEVLPAYVVSKKGQNIHVFHAAPAAASPRPPFCVGACLVRRRRCLCRGMLGVRQRCLS